MGDEGANLKALLSQGLLAASGFQGLPIAQNKGPQFAAPAFSISLLGGCIGFLENLTGNETLTKINRYTSALCHTLVVPLVAAEVCLKYGVQWEYAAAHVAYPAIHYIFSNILENEDTIQPKYLELSHAISVATIAYFSYCESQEWAAILAIVYALATLGSNLIDDPQANKVALAIGNFIHALKVI